MRRVQPSSRSCARDEDPGRDRPQDGRVPEGLSASEVGKEIGEHAAHHGAAHTRRDELISIGEAVLLSIVTIVAAWSGYSAAKWSTHSSLALAKGTATRAKANRAFEQSLTLRAQDAANFNAWFAAYLAGNKRGQQVAEKRFRAEYDVAFRAWLATKPFTNRNAPKGPQYMPQYKPTGAALSKQLDREADAYYAAGEHAASTGDKYIRVTVILASVLFLVGISSHFPLRGVRYGLVSLGTALLIFAAIEILSLPGPPA
jgi:hypothetical protein